MSFLTKAHEGCAQLISKTHLFIVAFACSVTYALVVTGLDWKYFLATYTEATRPFLFIADGLGFFIPVIAVPVFIGYAFFKKSASLRHVSLALMTAIVTSFVLSMTIKVFTGRISPPHHGPFDVDISGAFQFGFMNYQIIGGWPSSHAMVMFALATCVYVLFPESRRLVIGAYLLAFFVGIGVTFGFHWLSEFIAGACFGVIVGRVVGEIYTRKEQI